MLHSHQKTSNKKERTYNIIKSIYTYIVKQKGTQNITARDIRLELGHRMNKPKDYYKPQRQNLYVNYIKKIHMEHE